MNKALDVVDGLGMHERNDRRRTTSREPSHASNGASPHPDVTDPAVLVDVLHVRRNGGVGVRLAIKSHPSAVTARHPHADGDGRVETPDRLAVCGQRQRESCIPHGHPIGVPTLACHPPIRT